MEIITGLFAGFGLSASAGLNAYIPLIIIALTARFTDLFHLTEPWSALTNWWVIGALLVLSVIEFFADKIPVVDHANDVIHSLIRPTAGAIAFAASAHIITDLSPILAMVIGLFVAGSVHATKAVVVRPAVNMMAPGLGAAAVSTVEDFTATVVSILAIVFPFLVGILLFAFLFFLIRFFIIRRRGKKRVEELRN